MLTILQNPSFVVGGTSDLKAPGRIPGGEPVAVIDIGSNSVRLVVYEHLSRSPTMLFNEKVLAGLGRGVGSTGKLPAKGVETALSAIRRFRALANQSGVKDIYILATAAVRDAANGPEFLANVKKICGVQPLLLSGTDEARLAATGVIAGVDHADGVVGDLGGGSLELTDIRAGKIGYGRTYPLGGIRLEEAAEGNVKKAEKIIADALAGAADDFACIGRPFYAVGGTWRSLARLHMAATGYPLLVMHHYAIPSNEALDFARMVARRSPEMIDSIEVVSKARQPLLPFGALLLENVISVLRPREIVISAIGVREGLLYEALAPEDQALDPLIEACAELAFLRSRSPRHAQELVPWTTQAFAALGVEESGYEARLRQAACLTSDIGWRAHPDYRGEQSLNILANASFVGIDHPGRAFLALASYYRHAGLVDDVLSPRIRELASTRLKERARLLGAALRVAFLISASMPGVLPRTAMAVADGRLLLFMPRDLADLRGERLEKRLIQLAKMAGLKEAQIVIEG